MTRTSPTRTAGPDDRLRTGDMRSSSRTTGARLFQAPDRTAEDGPVACVSSGFVPSGGAEHEAGLYTAVVQRANAWSGVVWSPSAQLLQLCTSRRRHLTARAKRKAWTS